MIINNKTFVKLCSIIFYNLKKKYFFNIQHFPQQLSAIKFQFSPCKFSLPTSLCYHCIKAYYNPTYVCISLSHLKWWLTDLPYCGQATYTLCIHPYTMQV